METSWMPETTAATDALIASMGKKELRVALRTALAELDWFDGRVEELEADLSELQADLTITEDVLGKASAVLDQIHAALDSLLTASDEAVKWREAGEAALADTARVGQVWR